MWALTGLAHTLLTVRDADRANRRTTMLIVQGIRFAPLSRFFHERNFSLASEDLYARSLGLLIDYLFAREKDFTDGSGNLNSGDEWIADLTAAMLAASRRQDEQATTPEPQPGVQGQGGIGCGERREDAGRVGAAV